MPPGNQTYTAVLSAAVLALVVIVHDGFESGDTSPQKRCHPGRKQVMPLGEG